MINKLSLPSSLNWARNGKEKLENFYQSVSEKYPKLIKVLPSSFVSPKEEENFGAGYLNHALILDRQSFHEVAEAKVHSLMKRLKTVGRKK